MTMKLKSCESAVVAQNKIDGYLLNVDHPQGGSKALFLIKFGYSLDNARELEKSLLAYACEAIVVKSELRHSFGVLFTTEGRLRTPDGRNPFIRAGWIFDKNLPDIPRLITIIPLKNDTGT